MINSNTECPDDWTTAAAAARRCLESVFWDVSPRVFALYFDIGVLLEQGRNKEAVQLYEKGRSVLESARHLLDNEGDWRDPENDRTDLRVTALREQLDGLERVMRHIDA